MNAKIFNRDFDHPADGWYQIEAKGEHPNRAAKVVQVIDADAINRIVNQFNADASEGKLSHGNEMLIDHEHFKHDMEKETRAYGWLQELQNRTDGIYGKIRWSATGKAAVDGGDYRFFSTEYNPSDLVVLNSASPQRVRPRRLDGLTLTNNPNNKGQKPITNRQPEFNRARFQAHNQNPSNQTQSGRIHNKVQMNTIAELLGLPPEADEQAIIEEIKKLQSHLKELDADQVDEMIAEKQVADPKLKNRLRTILKAINNREERLETLNDLVRAPRTNVRVLNRNEGRANVTTIGGDDPDERRAISIRNRAQEIRKQYPHRPFDTCWRIAESEQK